MSACNNAHVAMNAFDGASKWSYQICPIEYHGRRSAAPPDVVAPKVDELTPNRVSLADQTSFEHAVYQRPNKTSQSRKPSNQSRGKSTRLFPIHLNFPTVSRLSTSTGPPSQRPEL